MGVKRGAIQPAPDGGLVGAQDRRVDERRVLDDQRLVVPAAVLPSHPRVDRRFLRRAHVHDAARVGILIREDDLILVLEDLERVGEVRRARDARQVAAHLRVQLRPVRAVLLTPRERFRRVRNPSADHHAQAGRDGAHGAHLERLLRRGAAALRLQVPEGRVHRLPDAVQVRVSVDPPELSGGLARQAGGGKHDERDHGDGGHHRQRALQLGNHRAFSFNGRGMPRPYR